MYKNVNNLLQLPEAIHAQLAAERLVWEAGLVAGEVQQSHWYLVGAPWSISDPEWRPTNILFVQYPSLMSLRPSANHQYPLGTVMVEGMRKGDMYSLLFSEGSANEMGGARLLLPGEKVSVIVSASICWKDQLGQERRFPRQA